MSVYNVYISTYCCASTNPRKDRNFTRQSSTSTWRLLTKSAEWLDPWTRMILSNTQDTAFDHKVWSKTCDQLALHTSQQCGRSPRADFACTFTQPRSFKLRF